MRGLVQKPLLGDECMGDGTIPAERNNAGCWLMNEGSGNKVFDLSGNGNTGIIEGNAFWSVGQTGPVIDCDGNGDGVDCGNAASLNMTAEVTVIVKVKLDNLYPYQQYVSKRSEAGNTPIQWAFAALESGKADELSFWVYTAAGGNDYYETSAANLATGVWYTLAATYNKGTVHIYVNGLEEAGAVVGTMPTALESNNDPVHIGHLDWSDSYDVDGQFEYVMLYNRALSAYEIALLYREPFCDLGPRRFIPYVPAAAGVAPTGNLWGPFGGCLRGVA